MSVLFGMKVVVRSWVPKDEIWIGPDEAVKDTDRLHKVCTALADMMKKPASPAPQDGREAKE